MVLQSRIQSLGRSIAAIAQRLRLAGYQFEEPRAVFPGPEPGTEAAIERIEREAGELPLALKTFWRVVGSVDFIGSHPQWDGCEYPDLLVVFPPSYALEELDEFLDDREQRLEDGLPYLVPIAPDDYHKANVSGGMWYNVEVPAIADDPPLNDERHRTSFMGYLALAVRWGGFPGLDRCADHTWRLDQLTGGRAHDG